MSQQPLDVSVYKAWLANNPDLKGTDDYKSVQMNFFAAGGKSDELEALSDFMRDKSTSQLERLGGAIAYVWYKGSDIAASMGVKGVPAAIGQVVGKRVAGGVGQRVGGAIGAGVGSVADQMRRGKPVTMGETVADVTSGFINPRGVFGTAATNVGTEVFQQLVDEGAIDPARIAASTGMAVVGQKLANKLDAKQIREINPKDAVYAYRYRALQDVKPYNIVVSPAEIERGSSMFNTFAGTDATTIMASKQNQNGFQRMVREQGKFETDPKKLQSNSLAFEPSTRRYGIKMDNGEIDLQITKASAPYQEIKEISKLVNEETQLFAEQKLRNGKYVTSYTTPEGLDAMRGAGQALDKLKVSHREIRNEYKKMDAGDPNAYARIQALKEQVGILEAQIDSAAVAASIVNPAHKDLLERLNAARTDIAVLHTIDNATDTNGLVSPKLLAMQRDSGVPTTGNIEKIALFHNAFKSSAQNAMESGPVVAQGATPAYTSRNIAQGNTQGVLSGGFPVLSELSREYLLSRGIQDIVSQPRVNVPSSVAGTLARQSSMLASVPQEEDVAGLQEFLSRQAR
jgi:hypothetical protein